MVRIHYNPVEIMVKLSYCYINSMKILLILGFVVISQAAVCSTQVQWGGSNAPWHDESEVWHIGDRDHQRMIMIDVYSEDNGESLIGQIQYQDEGPIGFRAERACGNFYRVWNQWGGENAPWNLASAVWELGAR